MRNEIAKLIRNLRAGLRLAFFLPVARLSFRIDVVQLLLLFALSAAMDFGSDWVRYGPDAYFSWYGAGNELFAAGVMMLLSALLALAFRQGTLILAIPVLALAAYPALQIALTLPSALLRWASLPVSFAAPMETAVLAWVVALFVRTVAVALAAGRPYRWPRAIAGGLLLSAPLWLASEIAPTDPWWRQPALHGGLDPRYPSPASEAVLATQQDLFDDALSALDDETPGVADLYFVGFAGDARDDVFRKDVQAAVRVMDERWNTSGKSVSLINNPRTLLDTPIATVTNLRATLNEIGGVINPDEDVVMVYLASHAGRDHVLDIALPPLELAQLTPAALAHAARRRRHQVADRRRLRMLFGSLDRRARGRADDGDDRFAIRSHVVRLQPPERRDLLRRGAVRGRARQVGFAGGGVRDGEEARGRARGRGGLQAAVESAAERR